jgi:bifunctional DNase/RNase
VTHDLLKNVISEMGGRVSHVLIRALNEGVFFASLFIDKDGDLTEIDCRSSDAIALAVRVKTPIFVNDDVMDQAGVLPEADIQEPTSSQVEAAPGSEELDIFADFLDTLDFDDFEE